MLLEIILELGKFSAEIIFIGGMIILLSIHFITSMVMNPLCDIINIAIDYVISGKLSRKFSTRKDKEVSTSVDTSYEF